MLLVECSLAQLGIGCGRNYICTQHRTFHTTVLGLHFIETVNNMLVRQKAGMREKLYSIVCFHWSDCISLKLSVDLTPKRTGIACRQSKLHLIAKFSSNALHSLECGKHVHSANDGRLMGAELRSLV